MTSSGLLLELYGRAERSGLLNLPFFQRLFQYSYFAYKRHIEDPFHALGVNHPEMFQGGHILDVGANIGYTATVFSKFISSEFKVVAFEPEPKNFTLLTQVIGREGLTERILPMNSAVGEAIGQVELWLNSAHHADHRILTEGFRNTVGKDSLTVSVPLTSIDAFVASQSQPFPVKFIKIDVQGYELPVCLGAQNTVNENREVVIAFEYAPQQMNDLGFSTASLIDFFTSNGFYLYEIDRSKPRFKSISISNDKIATTKDYIDIIASRKKFEARSEHALY